VDDLADLAIRPFRLHRIRTTVVLVNRTTRRYLGVAYRFLA
jgi:hypothetical protein